MCERCAETGVLPKPEGIMQHLLWLRTKPTARGIPRYYGRVVTPALNGSILAGITRKSVIELLEKEEIPVEERRITVEELRQAYMEGAFSEAFSTATAAVIFPVGELKWNGHVMQLNYGEVV